MTHKLESKQKLSANRALWMGILFSVAFTVLIWAVRPWLPQIDFLEDSGYAWYYWQLPEPTWITRFSVWFLYLAHQVFSWWTIYYAQRSGLKYTKGLHRLNVISLLGTAGFITLHLIQTAIWYDGLAQDVPIWSSQWSVIIMLVLILHLENQRRGIFFGYKLKFLTETGRFVRKYHGYVISWGIVYTFWYHPMENTPGHLIGFLYMFLLLLQSTLFYTRVHVNKYWTFVLEISVLFHGTLVAIFQEGGPWAMFLFGFGGLFIVTQMHGLGLKVWQRWVFLIVYIVSVLAVYSQFGFANLIELSFIPIFEYGTLFVIAALIWVGMWITGRMEGQRKMPNVSSD